METCHGFLTSVCQLTPKCCIILQNILFVQEDTICRVKTTGDLVTPAVMSDLIIKEINTVAHNVAASFQITMFA